MENGIFRLLAVGDVVGRNGTLFIKKELWQIRKRYGADFVIVNGENSAVGNGISRESADTIFKAGADVITTGNHVFRKNEVYTLLDDTAALLRPANYPGACPGHGHCIVTAGPLRILVMNLLGSLYLEAMESPFETAEKILEAEKGKYDLAAADFHAEATSEKIAFARCFDGRIHAVFGTHTHVQTNDARVLPKGTGYVTDAGMTGPYDSVLGVRTDIVIRKFLTKMPVRFEEADGETIFNAVLFEYDVKASRMASASVISELH